MFAVLLLGAAVPRPATAQDRASEATTAMADAATPRLKLRATTLERMPERNGRYGIQGRFDRSQDAGELREAGEFALIGRFAKAGVGCNADTVFRNGFEG